MYLRLLTYHLFCILWRRKALHFAFRLALAGSLLFRARRELWITSHPIEETSLRWELFNTLCQSCWLLIKNLCLTLLSRLCRFCGWLRGSKTCEVRILVSLPFHFQEFTTMRSLHCWFAFLRIRRHCFWVANRSCHRHAVRIRYCLYVFYFELFRSLFLILSIEFHSFWFRELEVTVVIVVS